MTIQNFPLLLHHLSTSRREKGRKGVRPLCAFFHSLDNDSDGDDYPFQSFGLSLSPSIFLYIERTCTLLPPVYYIYKCERKKPRIDGGEKRHSRRRPCSYLPVANRLVFYNKLSIYTYQYQYFLFLINCQ